MQFSDEFLVRWEHIINEVSMTEVPLECIKKVVIKIDGRKQKTINLRTLRKQGFDNDSLENAVSQFIAENEDGIASMDLILDVEAVAEIIQPETDKLLKGI
jgi:hypothetical protein